jgi:hypothetical protein
MDRLARIVISITLNHLHPFPVFGEQLVCWIPIFRFGEQCHGQYCGLFLSVRWLTFSLNKSCRSILDSYDLSTLYATDCKCTQNGECSAF